MKNQAKFILLVSLLWGSCWGEQLFVRNRPFKGAVAGKGASLQVDLKALAEAMQFQLHEVNGGYVLDHSLTEPEGAPVAAGQVWVEGKTLTCEVGPNAIMVNLRELVAATGGKVVDNKSMGTIDVYLAAGSSNNPGGGATPEVSASTHSFKRFKLAGIQGVPLPDGWIPEGTQRAAEGLGGQIIDAVVAQNAGRLKSLLPGEDAQRMLKELGPVSLRDCQIFWNSENACGIKATFNPGHGKPPGYNFIPLNTLEVQLDRTEGAFRAGRSQVNFSDCPICKKRVYGGN